MKYFVEGLSRVHSGEGCVRRIGECETLKAAVRTSQQVIDEFLIDRLQHCITAADLFTQYQNFGEVPFIFVNGGDTVNVTGFNHLNYAMARCLVLCAPSEMEVA
jgi:hypothetical protein